MQTRSLCRGQLAVALAVIAFVIATLAGCNSATGAKTSPTPIVQVWPTATPLSMATVQPTVIVRAGGATTDPATLGWVRAGAPQPDAVAVAPSAPGTLVTCTGGITQNGQGPITLSVSTDNGSTWKTQNTGIPLARCMGLAVSPTTPGSIALFAGTCRSDCGQGYERLYLTTDTGAHWMQVTPTPDGDTGGIFGWVGTTFFANTAPDGTPTAATHFLAVSRDSVHFAWTSLPVAPLQIMTSGSTLLVVAGSTGTCTVVAYLCTDLYRSTDLGASWTRITPTYQGINVRALAIVPGSSTLIGFDARAFADNPNTYPVLRSLDGGSSWQALPATLTGQEASTSPPAVTPDGTVYVTFCCSNTSNGIYKLVPGGTSWTLVSPVVPANIRLMTVSWNTQGQPTKLWGLHQMYPNTSADDTDLWWHSA